jgi:hypothetical protein
MYKNPWEIVGGYTLNPWPGVRVCLPRVEKADPYPYPSVPYPKPMWVFKPLTITNLDASNDQQNGRVPSQHVPPPTLTHQITTEMTVAAAAGEDKRGLSPWYVFFFLYIYTLY